MEIETTYRGKPLSQYTKEELIKIIEEMAKMDWRHQQRLRRDLDIMMGTR